MNEIMTDEAKITWAAGYFDGRGGIYRYPTQVKVIVTDKDSEVLARFAAIVGAGWIHPRTKGTTITNRLEFSAMADVHHVLTILRPHVTSSQKGAEMDLALLMLEEKCPALAEDQAEKIPA